MTKNEMLEKEIHVTMKINLKADDMLKINGKIDAFKQTMESFIDFESQDNEVIFILKSFTVEHEV